MQIGVRKAAAAAAAPSWQHKAGAPARHDEDEITNDPKSEREWLRALRKRAARSDGAAAQATFVSTLE